MRWLLLLLLCLVLPAAAQSVNSKNRFKVARSHFEHGEFEKSIRELEGLIKEDGMYIDAHYLMGLSYLALKNYPKATEKLKATIDLDPRFLPAYQFLGQVLLEEKKYPQAKEHFLKMANVPGGGPTAHYCLGVVAYVQKDLKEAEKEWRETLRLEPKMASAHNNLGVLKQAEGKHQEALTEFKSAFRLAAENPMYVYNIAWENLEMGDKEEAKKQLERTKRLSAKRPDLEQLGLATYAFIEGKYEVVLNASKVALEKNPDLTQALILQARALEAQKKPDEARVAWLAVLESDPNVQEAVKAVARLPEPKPTETPAEVPTPVGK